MPAPSVATAAPAEVAAQQLWPAVVAAGLLIVCAAALLLWHFSSWRTAKQQELEPRELDYRWRQFRRRMQTSGLLAVLAVGLVVGVFVRRPPLVVLLYWGGMLLLVGWLALLALVDWWATKLHFDHLRRDYLIEKARLEVQARQLRAREGNGHMGKKRRGRRRREK